MATGVNPGGVLVFFCAAFAAEPLDRVLFVVGERVVTRSDVAFETFFDAHDASPVPAFEAAGPVDERLRDIAVIRQLAGDISVFQPSAADVRTRADAFLAHWPRADDGLAALRAWGLDESGFLGLVYSRLVVERCVRRSVPLPADLTDTAALVAWSARYDAWVAEVRGRTSLRDLRELDVGP